MLDAQTKLAKQKLKSAKIKELMFSFSYGLMSFNQNDKIDEVLETVDELMYENKQKTR